MALDRNAAEQALANVGKKLGLMAVDTAWGIHRMVVENMAAAARIHIVEKGKDPRAYAMVGFGGAGPAHAAEVARVLGVNRNTAAHWMADEEFLSQIQWQADVLTQLELMKDVLADLEPGIYGGPGIFVVQY